MVRSAQGELPLVLLGQDPSLPALEISSALYSICRVGAVRMLLASEEGKGRWRRGV